MRKRDANSWNTFDYLAMQKRIKHSDPRVFDLVLP
jgi:hypothetical protein